MIRPALALLLLAAAAAARDVPRLLEAPEAKDRAWGCWLAGEQGTKSAVPALRRRINDENATVRRLALDALIRTGAEVEWQELQPVWDSERACVLILLARSPDAALLLDLLDSGMNAVEKTVVCNLLSGMRAPGFAARMLADVVVDVRITVVDPGASDFIGLGGGAGGAFAGRGRMRLAEGWPPLVQYEIVDGLTAGAVVFSPGPFPVSYVRRVWEKTESFRRVPGPRPGFRDRPLRYLADALQFDELPLSARYNRQIQWRGADSFLQEVSAARQRVRDDYDGVVALLRERGFLTQDEANRLEPRMDVQITDLRAERTAPLPELAGS